MINNEIEIKAYVRDFENTLSFLYKNAKILKNYVKELWVDGGLRTQKNIQTALYLGADRVLIARPLITETCRKFMGI